MVEQKQKAGRTISAHEFPLAKVFSDEYAFSIPGYQRPYSWGTEQAGELLDDLLGYLGPVTTAIEEMDPYFLGSIVLIKGEAADSEVVDGQQRLTTLTILLAALRACATAEEEDDLTTFICEKGNKFSGAKDRYRIVLRERDQAFFQTHIQAKGGIETLENLKEVLNDSQVRVRENALHFLSKLATVPNERRTRLGQFILTRCFLVVVTTPDLDSAFRIFSVLNDRGLDLAATDIIKAKVIGDVPAALRDKYTATWEDLEEDLGRDGFNELFSHIRMIYRRAKPQGTLTKEFDEHVLRGRTATDVIDEVIAPLAAAFRDIKGQSYESTEDAGEINKLFYWLGKVDYVDWVPPAILFMSKHRGDPQLVHKFVSKLDRLAYGLMMVRADVNERIKRFSDLVGAIAKGIDLYAAGSPLDLSSDEQNKVLDALDGNLYEQVKIRLPVLLRLDAALSDGSASYEVPVLTIEHVMPQNPKAGGRWTELITDENRRRAWVHRLGNLALLSRRKNSQAQNFEFDRKKKEYFQNKKGTPFVLTSQVLAEAEWNEEVLKRRQADLLKELSRLWNLTRTPPLTSKVV